MRPRTALPLLLVTIGLALGGCTGAEEPDPEPTTIVDGEPSSQPPPEEPPIPRLDLVAADDPADLAELPERLTAAAEIVRLDEVSCSGDLSPSTPVVHCALLEGDGDYTAHLVRTGPGGEDAGVLLSLGELPKELEDAISASEASVDFAPGVPLFEKDPVGLEPSPLRLRAEMSVHGMGIDLIPRHCEAPESDIVVCDLVNEDGSEPAARITLLPAMHTSDNLITLGVHSPL